MRPGDARIRRVQTGGLSISRMTRSELEGQAPRDSVRVIVDPGVAADVDEDVHEIGAGDDHLLRRPIRKAQTMKIIGVAAHGLSTSAAKLVTPG